MIRISSGSLKGRAIPLNTSGLKPSTVSFRPTQALVKKALFSIIKNRLDQATFLDLFAGSGAVGIEAFSNGAERVYFVENHPLLARNLDQNLNRLKVVGDVFSHDYLRSLGYFKRKKIRFQIIFADPPYDRLMAEEKNYSELVTLILKAQILDLGGLLVVERSRKTKPLQSEELNCSRTVLTIDTRTYGDSALDFYRTTR